MGLPWVPARLGNDGSSVGKPVAPLFELAGLDASAPPNPGHHLAAETYYEVCERGTRQ